MAANFEYDPESNNWSFTVPELGIVGGASTRDEAEKLAMEAVDFTLKSEAEPKPKMASMGSSGARRRFSRVSRKPSTARAKHKRR